MKTFSKLFRTLLTFFLISSQILLSIPNSAAMPGVLSTVPPVTPNIAATAFNKFAYNDRSELAESARYLGTNITVLTVPVRICIILVTKFFCTKKRLITAL